MARLQMQLDLIADIRTAETQILQEQKAVDFDIKEFTTELLIQKLKKEEIYIPGYQRKFIWKEPRQSKFIESVILGLPIPYLFCSDMEDGRLEVVDGTQRLRTLEAFIDGDLRLLDLEKLTALIGYRFRDLPISQQRKFQNRTIRMIVLGGKADDNVRFDLFERINSGSESLSPAEFRKGAFKGPFYDLILELAQDSIFRKLCPVGRPLEDRGEREELVLRFFAYSEKYNEFTHDVTNFLNDYIKERNRNPDIDDLTAKFSRMIAFVENHFPYGFRRSKTHNSTPRVRFEAISVGVHLALSTNPDLMPGNMQWLESQDFKNQTTTHGSNSAPRLKSRIEFVRDSLLRSAQ